MQQLVQVVVELVRAVGRAVVQALGVRVLVVQARGVRVLVVQALVVRCGLWAYPPDSCYPPDLCNARQAAVQAAAGAWAVHQRWDALSGRNVASGQVAGVQAEQKSSKEQVRAGTPESYPPDRGSSD